MSNTEHRPESNTYTTFDPVTGQRLPKGIHYGRDPSGNAWYGFFKDADIYYSNPAKYDRVEDAVEGLSLWHDGAGRRRVAAAINELADVIFEQNAAVGWWDEAETIPEQFLPHLIASKIALMHSELSEALEGMRKNLPDDHLPHRQMIEVELADAIIHILDTARFLKLDVGGAVVEKLQYNSTRADHKRENRDGVNGKKI